jgi:hypothetical protein
MTKPYVETPYIYVEICNRSLNTIETIMTIGFDTLAQYSKPCTFESMPYACTTKKMVNNLQYPKDVGSSYPQLDLFKFISCMFQFFVSSMVHDFTFVVRVLLDCPSFVSSFLLAWLHLKVSLLMLQNISNVYIQS